MKATKISKEELLNKWYVLNALRPCVEDVAKKVSINSSESIKEEALETMATIINKLMDSIEKSLGYE